MAIDYKTLPRVSDSMSFLYLEMCRIEQDDLAIASWDLLGITHIPIANLHALLLGPGTVITQAAVRAIVENGCAIIWCGERGVRTYAMATGETRSAKNLIRQATLATRENTRLEVVTRMYRMRFCDPLPPESTLQQIRGMEGIRVRKAYQDAAKKHGVEWDRRNYNRRDWDNSNPINKALSSANSCLYGLCHAVIVALGYSPGLGFIHCGKQLSFAYDIADLYKVDYAVPVAFEATKEDLQQQANIGKIPPKERLTIDQRTRLKMRNMFNQTKFIERIPRDIAHVLNIKNETITDHDDPWSEDPAAPAPLWEPKTGASSTLLVADSANKKQEKQK